MLGGAFQVLNCKRQTVKEGLVNTDLFRNDRINPLLETIKNAFPLAFDLSLTHLEKIAPKYDFYLSEDEIGYIALHLAGAI